MTGLELLIPALAPVAADAIRGIVGRLTGGSGAQPQNVDEAIKLMQARTENLRAVAELDKPSGNLSQWVADLRASFRYVAAGLVILTAIGALVFQAPPEQAGLAWDAAQSVWAFIFGDRMYNYIKGR